jgi:hypothetical protein
VIIIAVDPGDTCGVATLDEAGLLSYTQRPWRAAVDELVVPWLDKHPTTVCSVERFTIGQQTVKMSRQPTALHVIGTIKTECARRKVRMVQYAPGDAKKLGGRTTQRRLGLYRPSEDHAGDALAHLLLTLANHDRRAFGNLLRYGTVNVT